jgi:hypothetical protein
MRLGLDEHFAGWRGIWLSILVIQILANDHFEDG